MLKFVITHYTSLFFLFLIIVYILSIPSQTICPIIIKVDEVGNIIQHTSQIIAIPIQITSKQSIFKL